MAHGPTRPFTPPGWHPVSLDLADPPNARPVRATARVLTPAPTATFGVVSDMDDTVLQSEVTSFLRAARMVLLENALTRLPFPGVAAFYRALERGAHRRGSESPSSTSPAARGTCTMSSTGSSRRSAFRSARCSCAIGTWAVSRSGTRDTRAP